MPHQDIQTLARFPNVVWDDDVLKADVNTGEGCSGRYCAEVRMLLEKHFGPPMPSLTIDAPSRPGANTLYFVALDNLPAIRRLRDSLNALLPEEVKSSFTELVCPEPKALQPILRCARFQVNRAQWTVTFSSVPGVKLYRTYSKKIAASLLIGGHKQQVFLSSAAPANQLLYGLWNPPQERDYATRDEGMSFIANKNLLLAENTAFRAFIVDFISAIAENERHFILKDVAKTIQRTHAFLPQISFRNLLRLHTPKEIISTVLPEGDRHALNRNLNAMDLNLGYTMAALTHVVDQRDYVTLSHMSEDDLLRVLSPAILREGLATHDGKTAFLDRYAALKLHEPPFDMTARGALAIARDYFSMCEDMRIPKRFFLDGEDYLREHDRVAEIQRNRWEEAEEKDDRPLVIKPSRFDKLEEALAGALPECIRLKTAAALRLEGKKQHNCVFSRKTYLQDDIAAVFHWDPADDEDHHYTVQFAIRPQTSCFYIEEMKDRFNNEPLPEDLQLLRDILRQINAEA